MAQQARPDSAFARPAWAPPAVLVLALLLAALALTACSASLPSDRPGITGTITTVVPGDGRPASFLVEAADPKLTNPVSDKATVNVPPGTQFFDDQGKQATLALVGKIGVGTQVRVWFDGAVTQSYPVQGSAKAVQILGEGK